MQEVLKEEFSEFKKEIDDGTLAFSRYLDEDEYEDDYSHNQIGECQDEFIRMAREYLKEKAPGRYVITSGWCVFVMTVEEARKRNLRLLENLIVK